MSDDTAQLWLVERSYDDRDLIVLIYATTDGEYELRKELAAAVMHQRRMATTAAIEAPTENLEPVTDDDLRERYAAEATKMSESHEPGDEV
ncbi:MULTISPECIES: hypothetical protein [Haloferax]|uniref:DUF7967 domain-containing protein n=2 Tax=Haloferax TaxID=2251 RepID=A0A6G1YZS7_9EURY|nr:MULTISPECIES: hypothetical protein [Haloferax]KAB1187153.1 hypothetical protein Hfx1149_03545 [Haloferax sp. CBA1149]MRW79790.1 hypothetical protein [Haloferax marinisediminis]